IERHGAGELRLHRDCPGFVDIAPSTLHLDRIESGCLFRLSGCVGRRARGGRTYNWGRRASRYRAIRCAVLSIAAAKCNSQAQQEYSVSIHVMSPNEKALQEQTVFLNPLF